MFGIRDDLLVPIAVGDVDAMLEFWRWLIPDSCKPLIATALGDLFLSDFEGRVFWLEMGTGQLEKVADDEGDFWQATSDSENQSLWFGESLVDRVRAAGHELGPGQCYSYQLLPMLGGQYAPDNFRIYDFVTHFRVWGPIHQQLRDLPDGASFVFRISE